MDLLSMVDVISIESLDGCCSDRGKRRRLETNFNSFHKVTAEPNVNPHLLSPEYSPNNICETKKRKKDAPDDSEIPIEDESAMGSLALQQKTPRAPTTPTPGIKASYKHHHESTLNSETVDGKKYISLKW